jgi:hypothetical protein
MNTEPAKAESPKVDPPQPGPMRAENIKKAEPSARDDFVKKLEAQGKEWEAQLGLWGAKADKASAEMRTEYHAWQKDFRTKKGDAHKKLATVRTATDNAWEELKSGVETAWTDLKGGFENAKKKFD